jgi:hypothetical protein
MAHFDIPCAEFIEASLFFHTELAEVPHLYIFILCTKFPYLCNPCNLWLYFINSIFIHLHVSILFIISLSVPICAICGFISSHHIFFTLSLPKCHITRKISHLCNPCNLWLYFINSIFIHLHVSILFIISLSVPICAICGFISSHHNFFTLSLPKCPIFKFSYYSQNFSSVSSVKSVALS